MSERMLKQLLDAVPADRDAEERAWRIVEASYEARQPLPRRTPIRAALVLAAVAAAAAAAVWSPPGRAVVNAVRRTIGIEHAAPALFRLPAPGRLLVSGSGGTWVVAADGSKRRLGDYPQAAWSPHGLFVVAATPNQLATLEPTGRVHWTLARPQIRFPRWGGTRTDTRIAYLAGGRLHVVAGDGTDDAAPAGVPRAARVAPTWRPTATARHVLAYLTTDGRVLVLDTGTGRHWAHSVPTGSRVLAWSPDGKRLAVAGGGRVVLFDPLGRRATAVAAAGVRAVAFAPDGRLALLRRRTILLLAGPRVRTVFAAPGRLSGLAWSPDGKWLVTALPGADQWVFVQAGGAHRVLGVSHIARQFGGAATLDGWMPGP